MTPFHASFPASRTGRTRTLALTALLAAPLFAQCEEPGRPDDHPAIQRYRAAAEQARSDALESIDGTRKRVLTWTDAWSAEQLHATLESLDADRAALRSDPGSLPSHPLLRAAAARYSAALQSAGLECWASVEENVKELIAASENDRAGELLKERTRLLGEAFDTERTPASASAHIVTVPSDAEETLTRLRKGLNKGLLSRFPNTRRAMDAAEATAAKADAPAFHDRLVDALGNCLSTEPKTAGDRDSRDALAAALLAMVHGEHDEHLSLPGASASPNPCDMLPVGSRVRGRRTEEAERNEGVVATMEGRVIQHDERWLVIEATERWRTPAGRVVAPIYQWRFERIGIDAATGRARYIVRAGEVIRGEAKSHRSNWRGAVSLQGDRLIGEYGFDWLGMERRGMRRGTQDLTHPLILDLVRPDHSRD